MKKRLSIVIVAVVIAVLLSVGYFVYPSLIPKSKRPFQAVFLTNSQVYFGQISRLSGRYVILKNVYYLQQKETLQPKPKKAQSNLELAKLGSELQGPKDIMLINREQILFIEHLREDGKVVESIRKFEAKQ